MSNYDVSEPTVGQPRRWIWWAVAAGVVGLLLGLGGGYAWGAATDGDDLPAAVAEPTESPTPSPTASPDTTAADRPCLAAGEAGAAVLEQLQIAVGSIAQLDPAGLRQVLDRLQPLQTQLERAVDDCYGTLGRPTPTESPGTGSPATTPVPTGPTTPTPGTPAAS
jgi:hypothetical protein